MLHKPVNSGCSRQEATDTGDTYFVRRQSIAPAITALRQLHEAKAKHRPGATERAVSLVDGPDAEPPMDVDTDRSGPATSDVDTMANTGRRTAAEPDTSPYVFQLEKRIEEKDDEIGFLREELTDRRGQIRDMKGIIDGQNQLLETINANVAPIFQALATSVKRKDIEPPKPADVASRIIDGDEKSGAQPHGSQN